MHEFRSAKAVLNMFFSKNYFNYKISIWKLIFRGYLNIENQMEESKDVSSDGSKSEVSKDKVSGVNSNE